MSKRMYRELSRNEMIGAALGLNPAAASEIKSKIKAKINADNALALEFQLLSLFQFAGLARLERAPKALLAKARALARVTAAEKIDQISSGINELLGAISFDSWVMPLPVGVRGSAGLDERRLRLEAEGIVLDLRAEKSGSGWDFVGRLSGPLAENEEFVAHIGSKKIVRGSGDFYQWSSARGPRRVTLQSHNTLISFPDLSWSKPEKK